MTAIEPRKQYYIKVDGKDVLVREFNEDPYPGELCHGPVIVIHSLAEYLTKLGYEESALHRLTDGIPKRQK